MKFWVSCATQADLDFVRQSVEGDLPGANRIKARLSDWVDSSAPPRHPFAAIFDLVFTRQQDADTTWTKIQNKQATIAARTIGFRANYHHCTHGVDVEPVITPCVGQDIRSGIPF